jgi:hypothetical protein
MRYCLILILSIEAEAIEAISLSIKGWIAIHCLGRNSNECTGRYVGTIGERERLFCAAQESGYVSKADDLIEKNEKRCPRDVRSASLSIAL